MIITPESLNEVNNYVISLKLMKKGDEIWAYGYDVETEAQSFYGNLLPRQKKEKRLCAISVVDVS